MSPMPKAREGVMLSLRTILGDQFDKFLEDFLYKPIEKWAREGKIDLVTLKRLRKRVNDKGKGVFDIPCQELAYATRHTIEEGDLLRVKLPVKGDLEIDNFVKIFSSDERFRHAVDVQRRIYNHVKGTDLESLVVEPLFTNDSLKLVSYPFVNASSLMDAVHEMPEDEKEAKLLDVIKQYQRLATELSAQSFNIFKEGERTVISQLMGPAESFERFFVKRLGHGAEDVQVLRELSRYFAPLEEGKKYVIHGDLNPGNVILKEDGVAFIDHEDVCFGFLEFDYCKLLTKAGLSDEAEERIVRAAAENMAEIEGEDAVPVELSEKRYALNRVMQELFTAVRYLKRARENDDSQSMKNMALVSYTTALRKIDRAAERGFIGANFKPALEDFIAKHHAEELYDLGDKYEEFKAQFDPHMRASQDNVVSAPSLDIMLDGDTPEMKKEVEKELRGFRKDLRRRRRKGFWKKVGIYSAAAAVSIAAFAGALVTTDRYASEAEQAQKKVASAESRSRYKDLLLIVNNKADIVWDSAWLKHQVRYMTKTLGDERLAYAWVLDPNATYEAMQETGSKDYGTILGYLVEHHYGTSIELDVVVKKREVIDNWLKNYTPHNEQVARRQYSEQLQEARKAYEGKKAQESMKEQMDDMPNPALNL